MQLSLTQHFPLLLKISAQAGVLVLLVLAVQWIFARHLSPRWRYALWLLVLVRLAMPLTVSSSASLFNWLNLPPAPAALAAKWKLYFGPHPARTSPSAGASLEQNSEASSLKMASPTADS